MVAVVLKKVFNKLNLRKSCILLINTFQSFLNSELVFSQNLSGKVKMWFLL